MDETCSACGIKVGEGHVYSPVQWDGRLLCSACAGDLRRWGFLYMGDSQALVDAEGCLRRVKVSEKRLLSLLDRNGRDRHKLAAELQCPEVLEGLKGETQ